MPIPFLDLKTQYRQIEAELKPVLETIMANGAFIGGPEVTAFEAEFAAFCGSPHCVGMSSGTDALRFAMMAVGLKPGDEVITVANTFIATTETITQAGGKPVFVDIDPATCTIDVNRIEEKITPGDEGIAAQMRMLREHGQSRKYYHDTEGYTARLDAIQAAVLRLKLKRLDAWTRARRENAKLYDRLLEGIPGVGFVREAAYSQSVYHLYVILADDRDGLQNYLGEKGIGTGLHYPLPLHLQKAYAHMGLNKGDLPVTERTAERLLSLPMFAELTAEQIAYVASCVREYMEGSGCKVHGAR